MTSVIYALTLGTVVYLIVAVKLELEVLNSFNVLPGVDINVEFPSWG